MKKQDKTTLKESSVTSMIETQESTEIRSGLLILLAAVVLTVMLLMAGKSQFFSDTYPVEIQFNYISGLAKDAPVHYAGLAVGKVSKIRFIKNGPAKVGVVVHLSKDVSLSKDAGAYIDSMGFMGEKFIEIIPGTDTAGVLEAHQSFRGTDPVPMMELLKKGTEIMEQFEKTADSMQNMTEDLKAILGDNRENIDSILDNLNSTSANVKELTADLKVHPWKLVRKSNANGEKKKKRFLFF